MHKEMIDGPGTSPTTNFEIELPRTTNEHSTIRKNQVMQTELIPSLSIEAADAMVKIL